MDFQAVAGSFALVAISEMGDKTQLLAFSLAAIFALSLLAFYYSRLLLDIAAPMLVVTLLFLAAIVRSLEAGSKLPHLAPPLRRGDQRLQRL